MTTKSKETSSLANNKTGGPLLFGCKRYIPILIVCIGVTAFFLSDASEYLSFESLTKNRSNLLYFASKYGVLSVLIFVITYVLLTALSVPGGIWLTLVGGFVFGGWLGGLYVMLGATIGATVIFLIVRYAFAELFRAKVGTNLSKMENNFQQNAFSYLMFLRLVPLFPFWLVNIVPALLDVRLGTYILASFIGIVPGTLVYSHVGAGLGIFFDAGTKPDLDIIFKPGILLPMLSLALLSLAPILYRKFKTKY